MVFSSAIATQCFLSGIIAEIGHANLPLSETA
jgi:hypothetical protein